jgi:hypothetical protein
MEQQNLYFVPIPESVARAARETRRDVIGHLLEPQIDADGGSPCRVCLRLAEPGESMLLLSYNPFGDDYGPYSEIGPIFIHTEACEPYATLETVPPAFAVRELIVRAYDTRHHIHDSKIAKPGELEAVARSLFDDTTVAYLHVRHTTYTCYDFKIERASAEGA